MSKPRSGKADKQRRQEEGEERNAEWRTLTPAQKLSSLDKRLGIDVGAKRQRNKLQEVKG